MRTLATLFFLAFSLVASAQQPSRAELEKRRSDILKDIKETQAQLEATKKDTRVTMGQLRAIKNKLYKRQKLINNINLEMKQLDNSIKGSTDEIGDLRKKLGVLKMRYAQSVRYAYKSRSSYDMLSFLFSSDDFNEALRRLKYLKKYRDFRKDQAEQIRLTQVKLEDQIKMLNSERDKKDELLAAEEKQREAVQEERDQTDEMVRQLKGREKELLAKINKNKVAAKKLDNAVQEIIRREIEIARKKAAEEERRRKEEEARRLQQEKERQAALAAAKSINDVGNGSNVTVTNSAPKPKPAETAPPKSTKPVRTFNHPMTPEATALSNDFANNKGKLPWPVEKGYVAIKFGKYQHPIAEKVEMDNNGIDIGTDPGAPARAVFNGTVTNVLFIDDMGWNVIINHGHYFTLYSRLSKVTVKKGDKVATKQTIGKVDINDEGESFINFQVWSGANKTNPELWIAR